MCSDVLIFYGTNYTHKVNTQFVCICVYTDISNTVCYVKSNLAGWSTRILLVFETLENSCQIHKFKKVIRELKYGYHY